MYKWGFHLFMLAMLVLFAVCQFCRRGAWDDQRSSPDSHRQLVLTTLLRTSEMYIVLKCENYIYISVFIILKIMLEAENYSKRIHTTDYKQ